MAYVKQNSGGERVTEGSFFVFFFLYFNKSSFQSAFLHLYFLKCNVLQVYNRALLQADIMIPLNPAQLQRMKKKSSPCLDSFR